MFLRLERLRAVALVCLACVALCFLYFCNLGRTGLLGPDEPRYAAVGREMARSGDWLTPELWGQPWLEKPPLLYWLIGAGFRAGLSTELAPRVPVALCATAFLAFFCWILRKEFGGRAAFFATAVLATSAGWLALGHVAVTDIPLAVTFSAAMLLSLPWLARGERRWLGSAAVLLGLAVLAKGLVPLVLALPLAFLGWRRWRDWLRPFPIVAFLLLAVPWYAAMTVIFGWSFLEEFVWQHHFERFASGALAHTQPFWFYVPVILAGLVPWTPAVFLLFKRGLYNDPRLRFLLVWIAWGLVFFSASANKLPGYVLPLLPALAALVGIALAGERRARGILVACALLLAAIPVIAAMLPAALHWGITHTSPSVEWAAILPVVLLAAGVWRAEMAQRRAIAVGLIALGMTAGAVWLGSTVLPVLDRTVSARVLWRGISSSREDVCLGDLNRSFHYNLDYYSDVPLPSCLEWPGPLRIETNPKGVTEVYR
ncbi:MAG: glycosyltransferase family 39 protein [Bryobacteraceae bacterium]